MDEFRNEMGFIGSIGMVNKCKQMISTVKSAKSSSELLKLVDEEPTLLNFIT